MRIHISCAGNVTEEVKKTASALSKVILELSQFFANIVHIFFKHRCEAESQNITTVRGKVNITVN